jgi:hypothetical protein
VKILMVPAPMHVRDAYTRNTNCELKAVDKCRFRENPAYVQLARLSAAAADDTRLPMEERLDFKEELSRVMDKLCGTTWRAGEVKDDGRSDIEFWTDMWDFLQEHAPEDRLFQMFTREDLIDELWNDTDALDDPDAAEAEAGFAAGSATKRIGTQHV